MSAAVLLTFDFDAESPWAASTSPSGQADLTERSLGAYGGRRGILRIADLLDELDVRCTFFVPGWTADRYGDLVRRLHCSGHEIAHHGYRHVAPVALAAAEQREELERGIESIAACVGEPPRGYRSPSWQLTPRTLALLEELGFAYDSSCMGDDRPYIEEFGGHRILELPVHWSLDDYPYLSWARDGGAPPEDGTKLAGTWKREVELAVAEQRPLVLTCHPEYIGRPGPMAAFSGFARSLAANPAVGLVRCVDLATELARAGRG